MLLSLVVYLSLHIELTMQAPICKPTITEGQIGKPEIGGFISIECEFATCNKPTKIVFEKAGLNETWIQVFEGISTTQFRALETDAEYTLEHRNHYYAFRTSVHALHIVPVILKDHGEWRCVLYDATGNEYTSGPLDVNVYVPPAVENFYINTNNSHVLIHQIHAFTCVADGVHPETNALWKMNGVEYKGDATHQQRADQLWVVVNTINARFDTLGVHTLTCILKAKAKDPWREYHINFTVQAPLCTPTLREGQMGRPEIGGFIYLECGIETCLNHTKIVFEKTDLKALWTPIFEEVNQIYHTHLDTVTEYNIKSRYYYYAFQTSVHSLHILPLILQDHGDWRCVVYDVTGKEYTSEPLDVNVYVQPTVENVYISPNSLYLVIGQVQEFTCVADGIHPEPEVLWEVNGVEHKGNATSEQRKDQIWVVTNTLRLHLDSLGVSKLNCAIKTKAMDPWFEKHIDITVQEPATVLYPRQEKTEEVDVHSTFTLRCSGSGFNPQIIWYCDSERILSINTTYIIQEKCDGSHCEGSITSKPMNQAVTCMNTDNFPVIFECVIILKPPYYSSAVSAKMNVTFSNNQCKEETVGKAVAYAMLSVVVVTLICASIVVLVRSRRTRREDTDSTGIPLLQLTKKLDCIKPTYKPRQSLQLCYQDGNYETIVCFDYGSNSVYIHDISNLTVSGTYAYSVNIYNMIRLTKDMFIVMEHKTHNLHLVHLEKSEFLTLDTMENTIGTRRTLICAESDDSVIKCEPRGDDLQFQVTIYRVKLNDNKLTQQSLTPKPFTVKEEPYYISIIGTNKELVLINLSGVIYTGELENFHSGTYDDRLTRHIGGGLRSLYIDKNNNLIIGTRSGQIHVYSHDKKHSMIGVGETVSSITVIDERVIICCGTDERQQYIKFFSYDQLHNL